MLNLDDLTARFRMRKARTITLLGFVGAVLIAGILLVSAWDLVLVEWYLHELGSEDPARREQAVGKLGSLRAVKSVPDLVQALREGKISEEVGGAALVSIGEPASDGLTELLTDGRTELRRLATESLLQIHPARYKEIAGLLRDILSGPSRQQAVWALARLEPPLEVAVAALVGTMRDKEFGYRWMAASALGQMGPPADSAIPFLVETLKDENAGVAGHAALALAEIAELQPERVISPLRQALSGDRAAPRGDMFRERVIRALGRLGPAAAECLPQIMKDLSEGTSGVQTAALRAVIAIGPQEREVLLALVKVFRRGSSYPSELERAIPRFGDEAVPLLVESLSPEFRHANSNAAYLLECFGSRAKEAVPALTKVMETGSTFAARRAADALGAVGPAAAEAIPALVERARSDLDRSVCSSAATALGNIGPAALPALRRLLHAEDETSRRLAARALETMGRSSESAVPDLIQALSAEEESVRATAASALGSIRPPPSEVLPHLMKLLGDPKTPVVSAAVGAIVRVDREGEVPLSRLWPHLAKTYVPLDAILERDPEFRPTLSELFKMLTDRMAPGHQHLASQMLSRGIPRDDAGEAIPLLLKLRHDDSGSNRSLSLRLLAKLGPAARKAVPALIERLDAIRKERHRGVSLEMPDLIDTLGQIQEPRNLVVPALTEAAKHSSLEVAMKASHRLWRMGAMDAEPLLRFVEKVLAGKVSNQDGAEYFPSVRHDAARILAEMGPAAASALPALEKSLRDSEPTFRAHAAYALWKVGGGAELERAIDALAATLRQPDPSTSRKWLRRTTSGFFGEMGADAVPRLLAHLKDKDEQVRMGMLDGLKEMGEGAFASRSAAVRPAIVARLRDDHFRVRDSAMEALAAIGVDVKDLPQLLKMLAEETDDTLHGRALELLGRLGAEAQEAVPLIKALLDKKPSFRSRARETLERIEGDGGKP